MFHLILWWIVLEVLGLLALPIAFSLFRPLADGGYAFAKVLGLLLGAYILWLLVILDVLPNNPPAVVVALALFVLIAVVAAYRQRAALADLLSRERATLIVTEAVFLLSFLLFAGFRSLAPDIHLTTTITVTTEQPMDLAFLASTMRSLTYPPQDPWLSGNPISYYYFGYLALGWLGRLALTPPPTAYNLALVAVFALTATGAFGLVSNAIRLSLGEGGPARRVALVAGAAGAAFIVLWGNLVALLDLLRGWGLGSAAFWQWVHIPGMEAPVAQASLLPPGGDSWWWHSSRIILDGVGAEPIDEFPAWSLLLGDLHPHLMALPFALLALGLALAVFARDDPPDRRWPLARPGELLLVGLILGALGFVNSWDLPVYAALFGAALLLAHLSHRPGRASDKALDFLVAGGSSLLAALLLYLPFYTALDTQVQGLLPLAHTGTRPLHYLLLWGPFLGLVVPFAAVAASSRRGPPPSGGVSTALLIGLGPLLLWTSVTVLFTLLASDPSFATGEGGGFPLFRWAPLFAQAQARGLVVMPADLLSTVAQRWALVLPLALLLSLAWAGLLRLAREGSSRGWAFGLLLGAGGLLLAMAPELFFVLDLFGTRMNTVFKLHYQAWVLLGLGGAVGLAWLATTWRPGDLYWGWVRRLWVVAATLLLLGGAAFPLLAPITRAENSPSGPTLDGFAFYRLQFPDETAAIEWLAGEASPGAVVLEAQGDDYGDASRVAAMTGIPTVLGWVGHELQWRGSSELLVGRRADVDLIYLSTNPAQVSGLLRKYDVSYIYVGRLERQRYGDEVASRLAATFPVAWQGGLVTIFHVPQGNPG